jgi:MerR family transcriptional regulator/heat shock protein HspR
MRDVVALREVTRLSTEGVNLEGIKRIIELEKRNGDLQSRVRELEAALADEIMKRQGRRVFAAGAEGEVIPLRTGERAEKANQVVVWNPVWRMWAEWMNNPPQSNRKGRGR